MSEYIQAHEKPLLPSCPVCATDGENREWRSMHAEQYTRIRSNKHTLMGATVNAVVCKNCGYIMLFADPREL